MISAGHAHEIPLLRRKARIYGRECVFAPDRALRRHSSEELGDILNNTINRIKEIFGEETQKVNRILGDKDDKLAVTFDIQDVSVSKVDTTNLRFPLQRVTCKYLAILCN